MENGNSCAELRVGGSRAVAAVALALGCLGLALAATTELFRGPYTLLVFVTALLVGVVGLLDRRARLALSPMGIQYLRWGPRIIPWGEFCGYRWRRWRGQPYLQLLPHRPAELRRAFSALGRFELLCARLLHAPVFAIAVVPLGVTNDALEARIAKFVSLLLHQ